MRLGGMCFCVVLPVNFVQTFLFSYMFDLTEKFKISVCVKIVDRKQ